MGRKDRLGERKSRTQHRHLRVPKLGYYLIITDTKGTERCFFNGLHAELPEDIRKKLVVKVIETKTGNLIEKCIEFMTYDPQFRIPWIVFDRDEVIDFDQIIKEAEKNGIHVAWSNPCFEIWMHAYYGSMPNISESWTCCSKFGELYKRNTGISYDKADEKMYKHLIRTGDEEKALEIAAQKYKQCKERGYSKPSEMCPCTTVHELVGEIRDKAINEN